MIPKQDIQTHTIFSDGKNTIEEMVEESIKIGLESIIISDHAKGWVSKGEKIEFFPDKQKYDNYLSQISEVKIKYKNQIKILSALEVEVHIDGSLMLDKGIIDYCSIYPSNKKFGVDLLIGSIHSESFEEDFIQTKYNNSQKRFILIENMCNLIKNKNIDVFAHPFQAIHGHFLDNLSESESNHIINIFVNEWASNHRIFLEINGKKYPSYEQWDYNRYIAGEMKTSDLYFINKYITAGGLFVLGSDAHNLEGLVNTDFSIIDDAGIKSDYIYTFI